MSEFETDNQAAAMLSAIFRRKNPDGSFHYTLEEAQHWVPILIIVMGLDSGDLSEGSLELFQKFLDKVRADDGLEGEISLERVYRYYERHPVNRELQSEIQALLAHLKLDQQEQIRANLSRSLGSTTHFEKREAPKAGQVRAGPLAQFLVPDGKKER